MEWTKAQLAHLDKVLKTTKWTKEDWLRFRRLNAKSPSTGGEYVTKNRNLSLSQVWELQGIDPEITEAYEGNLKPNRPGIIYETYRIIQELDEEAK